MTTYSEVESEYTVGGVYDWDILSPNPHRIWAGGKLYHVERVTPYELVGYRVNDRGMSKTPTYITPQTKVEYAVSIYPPGGRVQDPITYAKYHS